MTASSSNPFNPKAVLALLLIGAAAFVALLYFIGAGATGDDGDRPGGHADGRGLDGYAALSRYLKARGMPVKRVQSPAGLDDPGLLILTPPHEADMDELNQIVTKRKYIGPTIVITPKWRTMPARMVDPKAKSGWVVLREAELPNWPGFRDDVTLDLRPMRTGGQTAKWNGGGLAGALPNSENVVSGSSDEMIPLAIGAQDDRMLVGYAIDDGYYPELSAIAEGSWPDEGEDEDMFPLIMVFDPDLFNNYGMADAVNARLAEQIIRAALDGSEDRSVTFDLTLNGYARSSNLLTLAFKPPFLAATLALLLAALAVGWRAFNRFGPARQSGQAIAFGKRALVGNAAGLIRRAKRLHLIGGPYADAARERLARALALPTRSDTAQSEAAIDRALAARAPDRPPFSVVAQRLRAATRPLDILRAAQDLHAIERTLKR